eukprot:CAMPEP_0176054834 /NCGR_PEP_ID=MMETSP0120_2-20121206/27288_1 /TAXON_ID=160619 /ORGANISM="Kryptoperidinium foliaceum, Strain CCMP 1326" /LENGTH=209 /DNA_ID=CAMNT_0017388309 /DNA_START=120 /DNA_END=749 /DNA_ORIENTATION=+
MTRSGPCNVCGKETTTECSRCHTVFYCSREHQQEDWKQHKLSQCHLSADLEQEISTYCEKLAARGADDADQELQESAEAELRGVREFITTHPFPSKAEVDAYIANGSHRYNLREDRRLFSYPLAKRLYEAGSIPNEVEKLKEIRRVGYLLKTSIGKMRFHYYLVQHILCGQEVFPEERKTYGSLGVVPAVFGYAKTVESAWNGVGPWMA